MYDEMMKRHQRAKELADAEREEVRDVTVLIVQKAVAAAKQESIDHPKNWGQY